MFFTKNCQYVFIMDIKYLCKDMALISKLQILFLKSFSPKLNHAFLQLVFGRIGLRMPKTLVSCAIRQELLLNEVTFVGMSIFVVLAVPQLSHKLGWCIAQMEWDREVARLLHVLKG